MTEEKATAECTRPERALLDVIKAWPDQPAEVVWRRDGTWTVRETVPAKLAIM